MKRALALYAFALAAPLAFGAGSIGEGGQDLSLGNGIPWSNSGFIDRGSGYDIRSGRVQRTVTDFAVTGSVGARPLVQQRVVYTEALNPTYGTAKTVWIMHAFDYAQPSLGYRYLKYPTGTGVGYPVATSDGVTTHRTKGGSDRIKYLANGIITDLWLGDGTHVLFSAQRASQIIDRNGLVTTLTYGPDGLTLAADASGRSIAYTYYTVPGTTTTKMRQATSSDGQWAQYTWAYQNYQIVLTGVLYSDGTSATYTHTSMRVPDVFRDTRADTRMQAVKFSFAGSTITGATGYGALYLLAELHPESGVGVSMRETQPGYLAGQRSNIIQYQEDSINSSARYEFKGEVLDRSVDSNGAAAYFDYDVNNFLTSVTDPLGRVTTLQRETTIGRVKKVTYPDGTYREQTFTSTQHPYFVATNRDELGHITTYTRNASGIVTRIDYPDASYETWSNFNAFHQPGEHRLRSGAVEKFTYDSVGRLLRHYLPSFTTPHPMTDYAEKTYYADGHAWENRVASERDPRGNVTTYEYDLAFVNGVQGTTPCAGRGLVTKITQADASYQSFAYDKFGNKVWAENELRQRTTYTYDDYQRLLTETNPLGRTTTYDYTLGLALSHTENKPSFVTAPSGKKEGFTYDGEFRALTHTVAHGTSDASTTTTVYDAVGNATSITDPMGRVTTFSYDSRDRKRFQYAPLSRTTEWQYDAVGNVTKVVNPDATFTTKQYDTMNRVRHEYDELNQHTEYTYHPSGLVNQIIDPRATTYAHAYDASDRLITRTYPGGSTEQWSFDAAGNLSTQTNRSGQILRMYYDNRNREFERDWDSHVAPQVWTQYDAASRVTWKANWHGTLTYTFDLAGQVTSEVQKIFGPTSTEDGRTVGVTFGYDVDGNRTSFGSPSLGLGFTYNNRQQLAKIQYNGLDWTTFSYNAGGERRFRTNYVGSASEYNYDSAGRLNFLKIYRTTDSTTILRQDFGYDLRDRRTYAMRDQQYGDTYGYQNDNQLTAQRFSVWRPDQNLNNPAAFTDTFAYDAAGNRTTCTEGGATCTYTTDSLNQYTAVTGRTIAHADGRGNITQLGAWTFTYDADNRLWRAIGPGHDYWMCYDAQGRLCKIFDIGSVEYRFFDGAQVFQRMRQDGTTIDLTIWGPTPDEVISRYVPGPDWWGSWQFYHQDALNSTVAVTNSSRVVLERYLYDAFGAADFRDANWAQRTASAIGNRLLFTGQEWWPEFCLHNYKARFYCSDLGRFVQQDPIRFCAGDMNLYRYVYNDPPNFIDPTGLKGSSATYWNRTKRIIGLQFRFGMLVGTAFLKVNINPVVIAWDFVDEAGSPGTKTTTVVAEGIALWQAPVATLGGLAIGGVARTYHDNVDEFGDITRALFSEVFGKSAGENVQGEVNGVDPVTGQLRPDAPAGELEPLEVRAEEVSEQNRNEKERKRKLTVPI